MYRFFSVFILLVVVGLRLNSAPMEVGADAPVQVELVSEASPWEVGEPHWVFFHFTLKPGYHTYWKNPGETGFPIQVEWELPEGYQVGPLEWGAPERFETNDLVAFGYHDEAWLAAKVTPAVGGKPDIWATVEWLACSEESCLPGEASVHLRETTVATDAMLAHLPVRKGPFKVDRHGEVVSLEVEAPSFAVQKAEFVPATGERSPPVVVVQSDNTVAATFPFDETELEGVLVLRGAASERQAVEVGAKLPLQQGEIAYSLSAQEEVTGLGWALILAFVGGMILNLMPCVLPVISFKLMSFVQLAQQSRRESMKHGLYFTLGVLLSFWVLASAMLILKAYGHAVGWGFQLQEPLFVGGMAAVIFLFALSLFGVFEMGVGLASAAGQKAGHSEGATGALFSGMLATVVATPCTGPFLGSAIGFAVTVPAVASLAIFTVLGLGMASPYLVCSAFPSALRFLPKPGNWMVVFKQLMGFVMLAAVLWLAWVFGAQTSSMGLSALLFGLFVMGFGAWAFGQWGTPTKPRPVRWLGYGITAVALAVGGWMIAQSAQMVEAVQGTESGWEPFSSERLAALRSEGTPVFVDFTAKWCLICQTNHLVLSQSEVEKAFAKQGVVRMKADWTRRDPEITSWLEQFGRSGVPLYVMFSGNGEEILPQVLTPEGVVEAVERLVPNSQVVRID